MASLQYYRQNQVRELYRQLLNQIQQFSFGFVLTVTSSFPFVRVTSLFSSAAAACV